MIARKAHPRDSRRWVFVPLIFDRQRGEWVPLAGPEGYRADEMDAARVCVGAFQEAWADIEDVTRRLRAFCDHPAVVEFAGDGIDGEMLSRSTRILSEAVEIANVNVERLLDGPTGDDKIRIAGVLHRPHAETGLLEAIAEPSEPPLARSPDERFLQLVFAAFDDVRHVFGQSVTGRGIEDAIDALILVLPLDEQDQREPAQFIADQRFARWLASGLRRARERAGMSVSQRGLEDVVALLQRIIADRAAPANGNGGGGTVSEAIEDQTTPRHKVPSDDGNGHDRGDGHDRSESSGGEDDDGGDADE